MADYTDSLAAEDVPFELLDAAEITRRWPQWRLADDVTGLWQAQGGLADPYRGNAAHRRLARAHGATLRDRTPVTAIRDAGGGDLEVVTPDGDLSDRPGRPRRRRLDQRAARPVRPAAAADDHQGAGHLLRLPGPGRLRAGPLPGLDLDGRPVLLRLPDLRRGRPEGRRGLRRPARSTPTERTFERDEAAFAPRRRVPGATTCRAPSARRSTRRPASTR